MTDEIPRLRFGIAGATLPVQDRGDTMADYVLSVFEREELELVQKMLHHAADACLAWRDNGIDRAMSGYNKSFNPAPPSPPTSGDCGGANVSPTSKGE
jgi:peptidyl-tRNA hydrolase